MFFDLGLSFGSDTIEKLPHNLFGYFLPLTSVNGFLDVIVHCFHIHIIPLNIGRLTASPLSRGVTNALRRYKPLR